jgi:phenylalanyl-tRNA synthetase alpha chain
MRPPPPDLLAALTELRERLREIPQADERRLQDLKTEIVGRKAGALTTILAGLPRLAPAARKQVGAAANALKRDFETALAAREAELKGAAAGTAADADLTMPGRARWSGGLHLVTQVVDEICDIFRELGFTRAVGPEAETERNNFFALNFPKDHPALDAQDSFYLGDDLLLRTHTSPVQIRTLERYPPPIRVVIPGQVYRRDPFDASHSPVFEQIEGLAVDEAISFVDFKATLATFARRFFTADTRVRFRPSFFPFTEPSAEMDVQCPMCRGSGGGCPTCKQTGWMEILGSGMVHPAVLENCGVDSERYTGFAWGMGPARIAMTRHGIPDIRLLYESDVRFLAQFAS